MNIEFKPLSKGLGLSHLPETDPPRPPRRQQPTPQAPSREATHSGVGTGRPIGFVTPTPAPRPLEHAPVSKRDSTILARRFGAFCVDSLFNVSLMALVFAATMFRFGPRIWDLLSVELGLVLAVVFGTGSWAFVLVQELIFKTSLGKWIFQLKLDGPRVSIFVRAFFFPLSVCVLGLGVIWALFDSRGRCWHDLLADLEPRLR